MTNHKSVNSTIDVAVRFIISHRIVMLTAILLITLLFGYGISTINVNNDASKALPADLPEMVNIAFLND